VAKERKGSEKPLGGGGSEVVSGGGEELERMITEARIVYQRIALPVWDT